MFIPDTIPRVGSVCLCCALSPDVGSLGAAWPGDTALLQEGARMRSRTSKCIGRGLRDGQGLAAVVASSEEEAAVLSVCERTTLYSFNESILNGFIFHIIKYAKDSFSLFQAKEYTAIINTRVCISSAVQCPQNAAFSALDCQPAEVLPSLQRAVLILLPG